jgi:hypothetical protein
MKIQMMIAIAALLTAGPLLAQIPPTDRQVPVDPGSNGLRQDDGIIWQEQPVAPAANPERTTPGQIRLQDDGLASTAAAGLQARIELPVQSPPHHSQTASEMESALQKHL